MMYMCEENYGQLTEPPVPNFMGNVMLFISREDEDEGVSQAPSEVSAKGVEALLTTMDLYAKVFEQEGGCRQSRLQVAYDHFRDSVLPECTGWTSK
jgi:hypothetical protein